MNIAVFHELSFGGSRKVANEFAKRLNNKHKVDLYIVDEKKEKLEKDFFSKVFFYRFSSKDLGESITFGKLVNEILDLFKLYSLHKKIAININKRNYDLVLVYSSKFTHAPFILRFLKHKKIYYMFGSNRILYRPAFRFLKREYPARYALEAVQGFIRKTLDKTNASRADKILVSSKKTGKDLLQFYSLKSQICYPGVDFKFFNKGQSKDTDILFIGSLDWATGEFSLFKSSLNFVKHEINVKIHSGKSNWVSEKELLSYYKRSKIIMCTDNNEALGMSILEAAACQVPAIAINRSGYKETILNGTTGYLVSKKPQEIASAIDYLLKRPDEIKRLGTNARRNVIEKWNWGNSIRSIETYMKEVLKSKVSG